MVTDEERDYMYDAYAADPMMRLNVGIRRRLAPLMENSRRRVELLNVLLFTLPGTPVVYYGDEIGMGDNIYLGDRNGVRTPMQWSGDRNGGFSRADPARLFAPPIMDPVYGYQSINVEAQERYPFSLLNWMKRMIALRRQHSVLGRGASGIRQLPPIARCCRYVRRDEHETVLVVGSLSRQAQPVVAGARRVRGTRARGDDGRDGVSANRRRRHIRSRWDRTATSCSASNRTSSRSPPVRPRPSRSSIRRVAAGAARRRRVGYPARWRACDAIIERDALLGFLEAQRWSGSARGELKAARFTDWGMLRAGTQPVFLTLIEAERADGRREQYLLPLATVTGPMPSASPRPRRARCSRASPAPARACSSMPSSTTAACDLLLEAFASSRELAGQHGTIRAVRTDAWLPDDPATLHPIRRSATERPNSSVSYGKRKHLKLLRRLDAGLNPEIEIGSYLTRAGFTRVPPLVGWLEYQSAGGNHVPLGLLQGLVHNEGETWERTLDELGRYFERVTAGGALPPPRHPRGQPRRRSRGPNRRSPCSRLSVCR